MFSTDNDVVTFGADSKSIGAGRGRGSVRLVSYKNYNHALVVADIAHMPGSVCGTWNALWVSNNTTWAEILIHWNVAGRVGRSKELNVFERSGSMLTPVQLAHPWRD